MPEPTVRARHVGYKADGMPLVRRLPNVQCLPGPEFLGARHIGYTPAVPLLAWAWECCDAVCPDSEEECYVQEECFTSGITPGISRRLVAYLTDVVTCHTARNKKVVLEYDEVNEWWYGEVMLRGGTLEITFNCGVGDDDDPGKFSLILSGCHSDNYLAGYVCADPLRVDFNNIEMPTCCDCPTVGFPSTDTVPTVNIHILGNCRKTVFARHVGYTAAGMPIVARERPCDWAVTDETEACLDMTCPIEAEIDTTGDCDCMDGIYPMDYASGQWINEQGFAGCLGATGSIAAECTDIGGGMLRMTVTITCGVTSGGSGFLDFPAEDLEDLDITVDVTVDNSTDPSECCAGVVPVRLYRP